MAEKRPWWRHRNAPGPIAVRVWLSSSTWVLYDWVMRLSIDASGDLYLWDSANPFRGARVFHPASEWTSIERKG